MGPKWMELTSVLVQQGEAGTRVYFVIKWVLRELYGAYYQLYGHVAPTTSL